MNCTHVWNYEQATPFLFGALAWSMREVEFAHATGDHQVLERSVDGIEKLLGSLGGEGGHGVGAGEPAGCLLGVGWEAAPPGRKGQGPAPRGHAW